MSLFRVAISYSDTRESMLIIFGPNVTEKVGNPMMLYIPTSPKQCFCTTWWNEERQK